MGVPPLETIALKLKKDWDKIDTSVVAIRCREVSVDPGSFSPVAAVLRGRDRSHVLSFSRMAVRHP